MQRRGEMGARSGDMDTPEPLSPSLSPNGAAGDCYCLYFSLVGLHHPSRILFLPCSDPPTASACLYIAATRGMFQMFAAASSSVSIPDVEPADALHAFRYAQSAHMTRLFEAGGRPARDSGCHRFIDDGERRCHVLLFAHCPGGPWRGQELPWMMRRTARRACATRRTGKAGRGSSCSCVISTRRGLTPSTCSSISRGRAPVSYTHLTLPTN